jgi:hypothetical protein
MREMIVNELLQAIQQFSRGFAHILPRIIVMLVIALAGWVAAYLVRALLRSALRFVRLDRLSESAGAAVLLTKAGLPPAAELLSRLGFAITWMGFILVGVSVLGILGLEQLIASFFQFLPRLFAGLIILFAGLLGASFFSRATLLAAVNANLPSPRLLSTAVRAVLTVFVLSMFFEELGVGEQTMLLAFGIAFGAVMLGLAIAFGTGGKNLAQQFLESKFPSDSDDDRRKDELSPL